MDLIQLVNYVQHLESAYIYKTKNEVQKKLNKSFEAKISLAHEFDSIG